MVCVKTEQKKYIYFASCKWLADTQWLQFIALLRNLNHGGFVKVIILKIKDSCFIAGSWKIQEHQQEHFCSFLQTNLQINSLKSVYSFHLLVSLFSIYSFLVLTSESRYLVLLETSISLRSLCVRTPIPTERHRIPFLLHTLI